MMVSSLIGCNMYDVVVIGAGPAGANAAIDAHDHGLRVLLIDEGRDAGGQVWRPKSGSILKASVTSIERKGNQLREHLQKSEVKRKFETRVWHIEKSDNGGWIVGLSGPDDEKQVTSRTVIIATGAQERIIPVNGWTLPGVLGLAGSTALMKENLLPPHGRSIVAGTGPLVFYVASEIQRLGGNVTAISTLNSKLDWCKALPSMILKPRLLFQGLCWVLSLYLKRIPIFWRTGIITIEGENAVEGVTITKVDKDWAPKKDHQRYIPCESVCYGQGLLPEISASRLTGADHYYDEKLGGWVPTIDDLGRTSEKGIYACGDNAGILGVTVAPISGKRAAQAVIEDLKGENPGAGQSNLKMMQKFGRAMTVLNIPRSGLIKFIDDETEICRCEGITKRDIDHEIAHGAQSHNAVKSGTRCGMGPCGGRFCMDTVAMLTAHHTSKTREEIGLPTARPPLRPVILDTLSGDLDYDDLPIPGVSPL